MNVVVHIDRLVMDGVALEAGQQHLLQAAVQAELVRLLAAGGLAPELAGGIAGGMAVPRIAGGELALPAGAQGGQAGRGIAAGVYRAIGGVAP
ncbi:hypothetical protein GO485_03645 [Pseudoduganella flava]|nr:hypothetical protein GO485_03645 [Pseudoduganella flava]